VRAIHQLGLQHAIALVGFDDVALADVIERGSGELAAPAS
jgi:hypothetical protein